VGFNLNPNQRYYISAKKTIPDPSNVKYRIRRV